MKFIGRETELKKLNGMYQSSRQENTLIYGRRRIGKSELIKHFIQESGADSIYYECKQTTERNNTDSLALLVSEKFNFPKPSFSGMEEELEFLFKKAEEKKLLLILDEYSYLRETMKGLDSVLQVLIDRYKETSKMKLILCGSFASVMKSLLEEDNPLFGRISLTIALEPMDYYESARFYPSFSNEDKVRLFSVFGGVPYYNQLIDPHKTVKENIISLIASPGARLENEVLMYLQTEIARIVNANEVFETLAKGYSRYSDILSQSNVSSGPTLADVLEKLIRMEVVVKEAPINDENNKKKTGYFISDNMSLFYYRYIFRYSSQMNVMNPEMFYKRYIDEDFETQYVPNRFENLCRQYLIRENRAGRIREPFEKIGKYYYDLPKEHKNGEFDVVTEDRNGYIFYEVKFRKEPLGRDIIRKEIQQVEETGMKCYRYGFISRAGFKNLGETDIIAIDLKDLYRSKERNT